MTVHEALPSGAGKADWQDYTDYWRDADATWIQDRIILRTTTAGRTDLEQGIGGVIYNATLDQLELKRADGNYSTLRSLPGTLTTAEVPGPPQKTTISHTGASGLGITFTKDEVGVTANFNVQGVLKVDGAGVTVQTGLKPAKLTTTGTATVGNLVSDTPVSAPGFAITGAGTLSASGKSATLGSLTVEGAATVNGVLTGGANSNIGGVTFAGNRATAASGYVSGGGLFRGDGTSAIMSPAAGGPYVQTHPGGVIVAGGGNFDMYDQPRVMQMPIQYYYGGVGIWNFAPSFYSSGDPGAQYFPEGTIWVQ